MSEFYFDYQCIAMNGGASDAAATDKALRFYLFQDYDSKAHEMCVQVYVPRDMQDRYCGARIYFSPNGIDLPDLEDKTFEFVPMSREDQRSDSYYIRDNNSVFIKGRGGTLSGSGIIAFVRSDGMHRPWEIMPREEDSYKFVVNYAKKDIISYVIEEHKSLLYVKVIYPLIRRDIALRVVWNGGSKPMLIGDREKEENILKNDKGEPFEIVLKARGRTEDFERELLPLGGVKADKADFRLVFADEAESSYYLLADESDYTLEDRAARKKELGRERKERSASRRCPYCGRNIVVLSNSTKGVDVRGCDGWQIASKSTDSRLRDKRVLACNADLIAASTDDAGVVWFPAEHPVIPDGYLSLPSMNVVVAGPTGSGKTIFLSSVMNIRAGEGNVVKADPFILQQIANTFDRTRGDKTVSEVAFDNIVIDKDTGYCQIGNDMEFNRNATVSVDYASANVKSRYLLSVGGMTESSTAPAEARKLAWQPLGFRVGNMGFVYFYDVPGEKFKGDDRDKLRSVDMADCFIAVVDGNSAAASSTPLRQMKDCLDRLEEMAVDPGKLRLADMPIAVVLTKHDTRLAEYAVSGAGGADRADCFDENCHIVREDVLGMMPKNGVYRGSALERHIECSSYELEHFLRRNEARLLDEIKKKYRNIKFFTCSALGSNECLSETDNAAVKQVLFRPRRLRVELPLIWLMYQEGLIRR